MKILKLILVTLIVNSLLLPFYGLSTIGTLGDILDMITMGVKEMFIPTCYIIAVYFLVLRFSGTWFHKSIWRLILIIVILISVIILSQIAWSAIASQDGVNHFVGFWGFYFLWTLLACILIPVLDRFYSTSLKVN